MLFSLWCSENLMHIRWWKHTMDKWPKFVKYANETRRNWFGGASHGQQRMYISFGFFMISYKFASGNGSPVWQINKDGFCSDKTPQLYVVTLLCISSLRLRGVSSWCPQAAGSWWIMETMEMIVSNARKPSNITQTACLIQRCNGTFLRSFPVWNYSRSV